MKIGLIFITTSGNTKKVSDYLENQFIQKDHEVHMLNLSKSDPEYWKKKANELMIWSDVLGVGSGVFHMNVVKPLEDLFNQIKANRTLSNKKVFFYLTYAGITSGRAFKTLSGIFTKMNYAIIGGLKIKAPHFWNSELFETDTVKTFIQDFYQKLEGKQFQGMVHNALVLKFREEKIQTRMLYPLVHIIGKKRELPIMIDQEMCIKCGKCSQQCPVKAIDKKTIVSINFTTCLHCYHCVESCPVHAIKSPIEKLKKMVKINKKIIGTEHPENKIIY